ncbi:MAG: hypothetical protein HYR85_12350 [Planctomycetes bacterium]|nr:hypothetical protein [Planctomycetota bacterium]MBI3846369.1 hypothetical protein [Planctomycetota bacterium]
MMSLGLLNVTPIDAIATSLFASLARTMMLAAIASRGAMVSATPNASEAIPLLFGDIECPLQKLAASSSPAYRPSTRGELRRRRRSLPAPKKTLAESRREKLGSPEPDAMWLEALDGRRAFAGARPGGALHDSYDVDVAEKERT